MIINLQISTIKIPCPACNSLNTEDCWNCGQCGYVEISETYEKDVPLSKATRAQLIARLAELENKD